MIPNIYTFVFLLVFFLIVFVLRSYLHWKSTGLNPITFKNTDDVHGFNGKAMKVLFGVSFFNVFFYTFYDLQYQCIFPTVIFQHVFLTYLGWGILLFSLGWIFCAQLQMSDAWRIGVDHENETKLIAHGLFAWSRNPVYLGLMLTNIGMLLVIPSGMTLLVVSLSYYTMSIQIRLEEAFLTGTKHEVYIDYVEKVRRWI